MPAIYRCENCRGNSDDILTIILILALNFFFVFILSAKSSEIIQPSFDMPGIQKRRSISVTVFPTAWFVCVYSLSSPPFQGS